MLFKIIQKMLSPNTIEISLYVSHEDNKWEYIPVQFRTIEESRKYATLYKKNYVVSEFEL
jgi:hypothetical protein